MAIPLAQNFARIIKKISVSIITTTKISPHHNQLDVWLPLPPDCDAAELDAARLGEPF